MKTSKVLVEFEAMLGLGSTKACLVLGVSYPAYAKYRSGTRKLPLYHSNHIDVIGRMPARVRSTLISERTNGI